MGQIATMLTSVTRTRSPLQKELDSLTKVLAIIAWSAVAFIFVVGLARGEPAKQLLLLGTAMAIAAIPTGLPAFVSGLLSMGAKQLAESKAVVKNLTDVETLGATSAINTDKTGTLTMNEMMVSDLYVGGLWFTVEGEGYAKTGAIRAVAGAPVPDFTRLALGLCLDSDATVDAEGNVVGDPTEAALVVLAAKLGVDAEETRRAYPRLAEVPFDSEYKFMATFHEATLDGTTQLVELVKGAPDVVLARCSQSGGVLSGSQVPIAEAKADIDGAERAHGGAGAACAGVRGPHRERGRAFDHGLRPDGADQRPVLRRDGRHHRPAAGRGHGGGAHGARGGDRRAHDHRRPRRDRAGHRREARARARVHQRSRAPGPLRRRAGAPAARTCTSSGGSPPRTSCAWPAPCNARASSWR